MKTVHIGVVHIATMEDVSLSETFAADMQILRDDGYALHDYVTGRSTMQALIAGLHEALLNQVLDAIWFYKGGAGTITTLDHINWELVHNFSGPFLGFSDFTHFALRACLLGKTCFYGKSIRKMSLYFPDPAQRQDLRAALVGTSLPAPVHRLHGTEDFDPSIPVIGGHSQISLLMCLEETIDLTDHYLFIEHHYTPDEGWDELFYWFHHIARLCRSNRPAGIILGHSQFYEGENLVDWEEINKKLVPVLATLDLPIFAWDQVQTVIPLRY